MMCKIYQKNFENRGHSNDHIKLMLFGTHKAYKVQLAKDREEMVLASGP